MWRNSRSADDSFEKPDYENHSRTARSPIFSTQPSLAPSVGLPRDPRFVEREIVEDEDYGDEDR